jgi:hypothetical protein
MTPTAQSVTQRLESTDAQSQRALGTVDVPNRPVDRRALVGQVLPLLMRACELRRLLGFGHTKFWSLQKGGAFAALQAPVPGYYSGPKVQRWIDGDGAQASGEGRFFGSRGVHGSSVARGRS